MDGRKAVIVGSGFVGSATTFALMESGLFSEMVLIDVNFEKAIGEAMDISHGIPFGIPVNINAGSYSDTGDADIVIITAGFNQKENETRLQLVNRNAEIVKKIVESIMQYGFDGIFLVVSNPVDILTYVVRMVSGFDWRRVIGSGTVLDTARLKALLGKKLAVDSRSVHAFIIGEHGDSEFAVWSSANVSGIPLNKFYDMRGLYNHNENSDEVESAVRESAYEIIKRKSATYYGIAMAVKRICQAIMRDEKAILPVSVTMHGEYGINDVVFSMPCIVGQSGIESVLNIELDEEELDDLTASATKLKELISGLELLQ